jgi:hypothetical protein
MGSDREAIFQCYGMEFSKMLMNQVRNLELTGKARIQLFGRFTLYHYFHDIVGQAAGFGGRGAPDIFIMSGAA